MKMIVGLGNPSKEYENTRHNVGFMMLDSYYDNFKLEKKFQAFITTIDVLGEKAILVKPVTFMNLSGLAVSKIALYYHISAQDILVIQDDMDIELGTYKLKRNSSSGGHNGIKSIISSLKTDSFLRLKIGISHNRSVDTIDYVLGHFSKEEKELLVSNFSIYNDIIHCFIKNGIEETLKLYSKKRSNL